MGFKMKNILLSFGIISIILSLACTYREKYYFNQENKPRELGQELSGYPFDFIVLRMKTESTNNIDGYVNLWIKNTNGESEALEAILTKKQIDYQKNSIYYTIDKFEHFKFKDVQIENKEGRIYLDGRNLSEIGNATLSEDGKLEIVTFYRTFH